MPLEIQDKTGKMKKNEKDKINRLFRLLTVSCVQKDKSGSNPMEHKQKNRCSKDGKRFAGPAVNLPVKTPMCRHFFGQLSPQKHTDNDGQQQHH